MVLGKELNQHTLCPIALDNSWKDSDLSRVLMQQVKKYYILDFSNWRDPEVIDEMLGRLRKGLEIHYG